MKAIVPLKITANEVGDEYYRLKQSDGVSECCMPLGRYDTPVSSQGQDRLKLFGMGKQAGRVVGEIDDHETRVGSQ